MGVPGFFAYLLRNYKKEKFILLKNEVKDDIDYMLIDTNCLIHPTCFAVLAENPDIKDQDILEDKMMKAIFIYIDKIIDHVNPKKGVYIAIDGVAPVAKMKQQRMRRFKSVADKQLDLNLRKKYNKPISTQWNNSAITPGTKFMEKLHEKFLSWGKSHERNIIYSSCYTPSEGEHKLLQFIRSNQNQNLDYIYIFYGLDADLIFLALSTQLKNIYLLREASEFDNTYSRDILNFISINVLRNSIMNTIQMKLDKIELNENNIINDFIVLCSFLGNDFIPHMPSLDISKNAIDTILDSYCNVIYKNLLSSGKMEYLIKNKYLFNNHILKEFIALLANKEEDILKHHYASKKFKRITTSDPYEREKFNIENLQFKIHDSIMLGSDSLIEGRKRYYKHYWNVEEDNIEEFAKKLVEEYFIGIKWVSMYYFDKIMSWDWYFPFDHPPLLYDINLYQPNLDRYKFKLSHPLKPIEQLLCVLPPQSKDLLPAKFRFLMTDPNSPLIELYPKKFEQDFINKSKYWMAIPILPPLNINNIKEVSKELKIRNKNIQVFIFEK